MVNYAAKQERRRDIRTRASTRSLFPHRCAVPGCDNPTRKASGKGVDLLHCRKHADHYARHGSPFKKSYSAATIMRFREAALRWIIDNADDVWVAHAVKTVKGLYERAEPVVEAYNLRGVKARERATNCWARLRKHGVDPRLPVAAWLAVELAIRADKEASHRNEYRQVQAAKVVHRMASGTHKRWELDGEVTELHKYPRSSGKVLRHIGADLENAVGLVAEKHMRALMQAFVDGRKEPCSKRPAEVGVRRRWRQPKGSR